MGNEDEARKQAEEDTSEDLELSDEDAGKVTGGALNKDQESSPNWIWK